MLLTEVARTILERKIPKDRVIKFDQLPDKFKKFAKKNMPKNKVYYSKKDDEITVWADIKNDISHKDLFDMTDFKQVIS